jgi:hypothetical protein
MAELFKIISGDGEEEFEANISKAMSDGWTREGGPFTIMKSNANGKPFSRIAQSMTKKAPKPEKPKK